ncbi:serine/threonine-protein kinase [Nocardioides sp.]|uniref:serine/threonine-protein kinase n=1 Tax=Nocardioides sp. TaxID=35761 RepID=UPI002ED18B17
MSIPSRIGRYVVRRRIGSGGFATVWLAYDEQLDSPVAVKVLAENWTEEHHVRQRFLEEGRFLRKVESPHVVTVYDAGELDDGRPYLVMSYDDQGTLADRLEIEGLTPAQALEVVRQIGLGLTALHERGVLHRDVKPANVLFRTVDSRPDGGSPVRAMLADLGLGKALDVSSRLTMIAGTPSFVAPEQAQGEPLDARADQYALAALTHLMLTGKPPFQHASLAAAAAPGPPPALSSPGREFPDAADAVVRRALDPDREGRWPDIRTYVDALDDSLGPGGDGSMPEPWLPLDPNLTQPGPRPTALPSGDPLPDPRPPRRSRQRRMLAAAAAVLVLAGGAVAGYLVNRQTDGMVEVSDATGQLSVRVPSSWTSAIRTGQWTPPDQEQSQPSLSAGTEAGWSSGEGRGEGVFVGVVAGEDLPEELPGHPACQNVLEPYPDREDGDPTLTRVATECPGVVVERVRKVADNLYIWIQVRAADRPTATNVLDRVDVFGF